MIYIIHFGKFLQTHRHELEESLNSIVPDNVSRQLGLNDGSWIERVAGDESRFALAEGEASSDFRAVDKLAETAAQEREAKTLGWAQARLRTITEENVLSFLSRKAIIPKYGFPVDVAELDTQSTRHSSEAGGVSLQRDLAIAVAEFAPTSKLVANKKVWTSYALKRVVGKEWARWWYGKCKEHNYFVRRISREALATERCCSRMMVAEYIDPLFGFTTNRDAPKEPTRRPDKIFTTRPYFAGFRDQKGNSIDFEGVSLKQATPGYMVILCEGKGGEGFYICPRCGAGFQRPKDFQKGHTNPLGKKCGGNPLSSRVALGHEFVTDVLQLQFSLEPIEDIEILWFVYSLAYALVEGAAEVLQVPTADLNATVASSQGHQIPPIILYDNVPGGAGLVARLEQKEVLRECLEAVSDRVSGKCGCSEDTSCYGCLRSYKNQFAHQHLKRGPVRRYLEELLQQWH
jgi:hypothetical protein